MQWALVADIEQQLGMWVLVDTGELDVMGNPVFENRWVVKEVPSGTIINIILYDGESEYTPPEGVYLTEVADNLHIGDIIEA